jgi:hypothetical protein
METTVIITDQTKFDAFYSNINKQESNNSDVHTLILHNVSLEATTILALHKLLPNLQVFNYNDPDNIDSDDDDDHHACSCHRNDRYE